MKSHSPIKSWMTLAMLCGIALSVVAFRAQADQWDKRTILTVDQPVQVVNTLLEPGKYVFKLADSSSDRHIVQIFNGDQTRIVDTILAIPNYRLQPTSNSRFMFWETPPGNVRALRAWFYPGDNFGQVLGYPKELALARTSATVVTSPAPAPEPAVSAPPAPATPAPPPEPQAEIEKPTQEEQPAVIAQNNAPPPPPPAPAPATQPAPAAQPAPEPPPKELPKTATPYPLIGLGGLLSLGLCGLLRLRRLT
jgi:hypothetical protein